jgi:hypothetical protein
VVSGEKAGSEGGLDGEGEGKKKEKSGWRKGGARGVIGDNSRNQQSDGDEGVVGFCIMAEQRRTGHAMPSQVPQGAPSLHLPPTPSHGFFPPTDRPDRTPKRVDKYRYAPPPQPQPGTGAARIDEGWVSFCPAPVSRYHAAIRFQGWFWCFDPTVSPSRGTQPGGRAQLCANNARRPAIQQNGDDYGALGPLERVCLSRHGTSMTRERVDVGGCPFGSSLWTPSGEPTLDPQRRPGWARLAASPSFSWCCVEIQLRKRRGPHIRTSSPPTRYE